MSTALGQPRPLNSIEVSSLKKLSMPTVDMALWFIGIYMSVSHSSVEKSLMNGTVLSKSLLGRGLDRIFGLPT